MNEQWHDERRKELMNLMSGTWSQFYDVLYNNKINARVLIGQSAMVYCAGKPMEKSRVFWIII